MSKITANKNIATKFLYIFVLIICVTLSSYFSVIWYSKQQRNETTIVDVAGRNKMLTQRLASLGQLVYFTQGNISNTAKKELKKSLALMERNINFLKDGGVPPNYKDIHLEGVSKEFLPKLDSVRKHFRDYKALTLILISKPRYVMNEIIIDSLGTKEENATLNIEVQQAVVELQKRIIDGTLANHTDVFVNSLLIKFERNKVIYLWFLVLLAIFNLIILVIAYLYLFKTVRPLSSIAESIDVLAKGEIPERSQFVSTDEIGKITKALNSLTDNLKAAADFAKNVGDGNLETQIEVFSNNGVLADSLYVMRDNLKRIAFDDARRRWTTEGLAYFADLLRKKTDKNELAQLILSELINYLKINQGGFFVVNQADSVKYLEMIASYAYDRKKNLIKRVEIGEGLVGQAYLDKDTLYVTDIPKNYVFITSGLGLATPTAILVVPVMLNDSVEGVIELGSFELLEDYKIEFVKKLAENIASTLAMLRSGQGNSDLLNQFREQAEMLHSQEEEMRQNMEELMATQEEIMNKEQIYLAKIREYQIQLGIFNEEEEENQYY